MPLLTFEIVNGRSDEAIAAMGLAGVASVLRRVGVPPEGDGEIYQLHERLGREQLLWRTLSQTVTVKSSAMISAGVMAACTITSSAISRMTRTQNF